MARDFVASEEDDITISGFLGSPATVSIAVWCDVDSYDSGGSSLFGIGANVQIIGLSTSTYGQYYDGGFQTISHPTDLVGNGWTHVVYVVDPGGTEQEIFVDGSASGSPGSDADAIIYTHGSNTLLGKAGNLATNRDLDGRLAEAAAWNRRITNAEISALAAGYSPAFFPNGLLMYTPLVRNVYDALGTTTTDNGTAVADHPRMIYPATSPLITVPSAVAHTATGTPTLEAIVASGSAAQEMVATGTLTAEAMSLDAVGEQAFVGQAALEAEAISADAVGVQQFAGQGTLTPESMTLDAVSIMHPEATATPTVEAVSLDAVGEQPFTGVGTPTLEAMTLAAVGVMQPEGQADAVLQIIETDAVGAMPTGAVADLVLQVVAAAAVAQLPVTSTATLTLESIILAVEVEVDTLITAGVTYTIKIKERPSGPWRLTQIIFQFAQDQFWAVKLWNGFKWEDKVLLFIAP